MPKTKPRPLTSFTTEDLYIRVKKLESKIRSEQARTRSLPSEADRVALHAMRKELLNRAYVPNGNQILRESLGKFYSEAVHKSYAEQKESRKGNAGVSGGKPKVQQRAEGNGREASEGDSHE